MKTFHDLNGIMKRLMSTPLMWSNCFFIEKMYTQKFPSTVWEFTRGKEDKDGFIQKVFKVCKVFKVKPLKTPRPDVPSKKTVYNLFYKDIRKTKKELQGVPVSEASANIVREWKKFKASRKKMKKYKELYEEEKRWHEEVLQRYQEDHMDEM